MKTMELDYIGRITIKSVRDYTLDKRLTDKDTVVLNSKNFDDVVLEYRETYKDSLKNPYVVLGVVLVEEDILGDVPIDRVGLIKNDPRRPNQIRNKDDYRLSLMNSEKVISRCGFCGNIVDANGDELDGSTFHYFSEILSVRTATGFVRTVHGYCCPNGHPSTRP